MKGRYDRVRREPVGLSFFQQDTRGPEDGMHDKCLERWTKGMSEAGRDKGTFLKRSFVVVELESY